MNVHTHTQTQTQTHTDTQTHRLKQTDRHTLASPPPELHLGARWISDRPSAAAAAHLFVVELYTVLHGVLCGIYIYLFTHTRTHTQTRTQCHTSYSSARALATVSHRVCALPQPTT